MIVKRSLKELTANNKKFRKTLKKEPLQQIVDMYGRPLFLVAADELTLCEAAESFK